MKYRLHLPIHELDSTDQILVNDFSNNLIKLYKLEHEKLVVKVEPFFEVSKDDDFVIALDRMIKANVANVLNNSGDLSNLEKNILTSKDLIKLVYQTTQRNSFMSLVFEKHNENFKRFNQR